MCIDLSSQLKLKAKFFNYRCYLNSYLYASSSNRLKAMLSIRKIEV